MIQLVIVYCMLSDVRVCVEQRPMSEQPLSLMGCMRDGPQLGAAYLREHPQWSMARWRCEVNRPAERPA